MTDLVITDVGDAWINVAKTGANYGDTNAVWLDTDGRIGLIKPYLPNLLGATVLGVALVGHGLDAVPACTITLTPITDKWSPGGVKYSNRPSVNAAAAVAIAVPATAAGEPVEMSAAGLITILQAVADGTDWHGLQVETSTAAGFRFRSSDHGEPAWELRITVSDVPQVAENLRPDGGLAVGSTSPIVAWDPIADFGVEAGQAQSRVQVDTPAAGAEPDEVAPDYDSGWQVNTDPQWSLAGLHTLVGAGPHYFRVNVKDAAGNESGWSDWAEFTVAALPTLVMDSPGGPFGDPSPTITAHVTGGTLETWRAMITGPDRSDVRMRHPLSSGAISWQVPFKHKGRRVVVEGGWLYVEAYDDVERAEAVGEQPFMSEWVQLQFDDDLGLVAPTNLQVVQSATGDPRLTWTWERTEAADFWLFGYDDTVIARVDPADVEVDAGAYTWTDDGEVPPLRDHTLWVRAIEAGNARSAASDITERSHTVEGVWILPDDETIDPIVLSGTAVGDFTAEDAMTTYRNLLGEEIDVVHGTPGRVFTFTGSIDNRQDVWAALDALKALRKSRNRNARLVWGSESINARLRAPQGTPDDDILPGNLLHNVRFGAVELD